MSATIRTLNDALNQHVRSAAFPVAIRLITPGESFPARTKRLQQDMSEQIDA